MGGHGGGPGALPSRGGDAAAGAPSRHQQARRLVHRGSGAPSQGPGQRRAAPGSALQGAARRPQGWRRWGCRAGRAAQGRLRGRGALLAAGGAGWRHLRGRQRRRRQPRGRAVHRARHRRGLRGIAGAGADGGDWRARDRLGRAARGGLPQVLPPDRGQERHFEHHGHGVVVQVIFFFWWRSCAPLRTNRRPDEVQPLLQPQRWLRCLGVLGPEPPEQLRDGHRGVGEHRLLCVCRRVRVRDLQEQVPIRAGRYDAIQLASRQFQQFRMPPHGVLEARRGRLGLGLTHQPHGHRVRGLPQRADLRDAHNTIGVRLARQIWKMLCTLDMNNQLVGSTSLEAQPDHGLRVPDQRDGPRPADGPLGREGSVQGVA
mmetsp:Transcript_26810/g.71389  ORF Transcript_26810/g.71389 Transcript_26810/m.71389 type:complete len:372 (+) Transcript_26810:1650-2765(+)